MCLSEKKKSVYLGVAENCNSGQPYYSKIYIKLIPAELFQILKDDAMKVLQSIWQQIWKTQQWPQDWRKEMPKNAQTTCTIALISHASKVMLKILQARFQ